MPRRGRRRKKTRTHVPVPGSAAASSSSSGVGGVGSGAMGVKEDKIPKTLVIRRGKTCREVNDLVDDLRHMLLPYTALNFREDARNRKLSLQQYASHLALPMGISHVLAFTQNRQHLNLRIARTPAGPTLHFRVGRFSLCGDVKSLQKRPVSGGNASMTSNPPVVVTNNFGTNDPGVSPHVKLMRITFQNMFPAINVSSVKLDECRRVVLFHLVEEDVEEDVEDDDVDDDDDDDENEEMDDEDDDDKNRKSDQKKGEKRKDADETEKKKTKKKKMVRRQIVQMRHYAIRAAPVGVSRRVRRILGLSSTSSGAGGTTTSSSSNKRLPNLHNVRDIADYLDGTANAALSDAGSAASDSEYEDNLDGAGSRGSSGTGGSQSNVVELCDRYAGRGNVRNQKSALRLIEMGPRLSMELIKVEKGLGDGDVLYHHRIRKSPEEAAEIKARKDDERRLKQRRRDEQRANVERKRAAAEEKRRAKRQRREMKEKETLDSLRADGAAMVEDIQLSDDDDDDEEEEEDDDDAEEDDSASDDSGSEDDDQAHDGDNEQ